MSVVKKKSKISEAGAFVVVQAILQISGFTHFIKENSGKLGPNIYYDPEESDFRNMNTSVNGNQIIASAQFISKDNENINKINRILQPVYLEIFSKTSPAQMNIEEVLFEAFSKSVLGMISSVTEQLTIICSEFDVKCYSASLLAFHYFKLRKILLTTEHLPIISIIRNVTSPFQIMTKVFCST